MDRAREAEQLVVDQGPGAAPEKTPVSAPQKTLAERVRELFSSGGEAPVIAKAVRDDLNDPQNEGKSIEEVVKREPAKEERVQKLVLELKRIVGESKGMKFDGKTVIFGENSFLPQFAWQMIAQADEAGVSGKQIPILTAIINHTLDKTEMTQALFVDLAEKVLDLKYTDTELAKKVLQELKSRMVEEGMRDVRIFDQIDTFSREMTEGKSRVALEIEKGEEDEKPLTQREMADQSENLSITMTAEIMGLNLTSQRLQELRDGAVRGIDGKMLEKEGISFQKTVEQLIEQETNGVKGDLNSKYQALANGRNTIKMGEDYLTSMRRNAVAAYEDFTRTVQKYVSNGSISNENAASLIRIAKKTLELRSKENRKFSKITIDDQLPDLPNKGYRSDREFVFSDEQNRFYHALSDYEQFKGFILKNSQYKNADGTFNWEKFSGNIQELCETLLSTIDSKPGEFFDRAFNSFFEGHVYEILLIRLQQIANAMSEDTDPQIRDMQGVSIQTSDFMPLQSQTQESEKPGTDANDTKPEAILAKRRGVHDKTQTIELKTAIGSLLVNDMTKLKLLTEYFHNVEVISQQGMGFEQLAKYAEQLSFADLDWLLKRDKQVALAINYNLIGLRDELALNLNIIAPDFGKPDDVYNLDKPQRRALFQLLSHHNIATENMTEVQKRKLIRKIRMASGITKGATGEFWNILMRQRAMITFSKGDEKNPYKVDTPYTGSYDSGYEKMVTSLDLGLTLERFGVPNYLKVITYAYQPRFFHKYKGAYRDPYAHTSVYHWRERDQDAYFNGRADDFADFQENNILLKDWLHTTSVGLFVRGGWRFEEFKSFLIPPDKPDFYASLPNMQRLGLFAVKWHIDNFVDGYHKISHEDWEREFGHLHINQPHHHIHDPDKAGDLIRVLQEAMYEKYLFGRMTKVLPTRMLALEKRNLTPNNESTILGDLQKYLQSQFGGNLPIEVQYPIMPLFVSAMTYGENLVWERQKELCAQQQDSNLLNYDLMGNLDLVFGDEHIKDSLVRYFREMKRDIGKIKYKTGGHFELNITEDQFLEILKGSYRQLGTSVNKQRFYRADHSRGEETLEKRYAHLLAYGVGDLKYEIGGDDFDFHEFYFSTGGKRAAARFFGETDKVTKASEAASKIINKGIPDFVKNKLSGAHQIHEGAIKYFGEPLIQMLDAIAGMDQNQANEFTLRWTVFLSRILAKDRAFRVKGVGDIGQHWMKQMFGRQASLAGDYFMDVLERPITILDTDEDAALGETLLNLLNVPLEKHRATGGYENFKLFGIKTPFQIPVMEENPWHYGQYKKSEGLENHHKLLEIVSPLAVAAVIAILFILGKLAGDKNKGKH